MCPQESVFLGPSDRLVACGSDGGRVVIYDADTGEPLVVLNADEDVANCVQVRCPRPMRQSTRPHRMACMAWVWH